MKKKKTCDVGLEVLLNLALVLLADLGCLHATRNGLAKNSGIEHANAVITGRAPSYPPY